MDSNSNEPTERKYSLRLAVQRHLNGTGYRLVAYGDAKALRADYDSREAILGALRALPGLENASFESAGDASSILLTAALDLTKQQIEKLGLR